jgi:hypothetical protein
MLVAVAISSAARSPIIMLGALMLPLVMVGITEASLKHTQPEVRRCHARATANRPVMIAATGTDNNVIKTLDLFVTHER